MDPVRRRHAWDPSLETPHGTPRWMPSGGDVGPLVVPLLVAAHAAVGGLCVLIGGDGQPGSGDAKGKPRGGPRQKGTTRGPTAGGDHEGSYAERETTRGPIVVGPHEGSPSHVPRRRRERRGARGMPNRLRRMYTDRTPFFVGMMLRRTIGSATRAYEHLPSSFVFVSGRRRCAASYILPS